MVGLFTMMTVRVERERSGGTEVVASVAEDVAVKRRDMVLCVGECHSQSSKYSGGCFK